MKHTNNALDMFCRVPVTHLISRHSYLSYLVYGVLYSVSRLQRTENISHILVMQLCRRITGPGSACDVFFFFRFHNCKYVVYFTFLYDYVYLIHINVQDQVHSQQRIGAH